MIDIFCTAVGGFGRAVAQVLQQRLSVRVATEWEAPDSSRWPAARLHVVAAWRETPALFERADELARIHRRPWLPITLDATSVRVGPLVDGRDGPCYQCFLARQFQHRKLREIDRRLFGRYDADPNCGPRGFLAPHVSLAAYAATELARDVLDGRTADRAGDVRRFGLLTPQVSSDRVVAVDGCRRCGERRADATWGRLADDLQWLRPAPRTDQVPA